MDEFEFSLKKKIKEIEKKYGYKINPEGVTVQKPQTFSSGSMIIDHLTGIDGYPTKTMIEIFGQPSTGKTTLALYAIKELQKLSNKKTVFFDLERTLNVEYAKKIGVSIKDLIVLKPKNAEETFDLIIDFLKTKEFHLIVVDSVAALLPKAEEKSQMEDNTIGLQARIMSKALRKINYLLSETNATIIFINQIREKVKLFFGNPEITTGGNALKFYASLRIELRRRGKITVGKEDEGILVAVKITKNKLSKPFQSGLISIFFGKGLSKIAEVVEIATKEKIFNQRGPWFWYQQQKLGIGVENTKQFLEKNEKLLNEIISKIKKEKGKNEE